MSVFLEKYKKQIIPNLQKLYNIKNVHAIPVIKKITLSIGLGVDGGSDKKFLARAIEDLTMISGRKPVVTKSRISIAGFKLREGQNVGLFVTLRGKIMYTFMERLVFLALPSVKDFQGFKASSIDKNGNFAFGLKERSVFPEANQDYTEKSLGMNIAFTIKSGSKEQSVSLLRALDIPVHL